ncbi:uncharacterized protein PAM68-like [Apium graveolens]|uniref:uncharacterized protein PAM68-like n=1 Tax=Apium graveolens TaxID=4045 RepID=UPI003D7B13A2
MRGLCCVEQSFLHITKLSPLKPKPPFLHPKTKWNIQAKAKGFSGASNKNIVQAKKGMPKEPENGNGKDYDDDDKIPQVVTDRMIKRILFYVGVPLVTGVIILRGFDVVKEQNVVDVPKWLPFLTTFITFGTSALGIAIGTLSASWDADREGSFLGFEEAQRNWVEMWKEEDEFN